MEKDSYASYIEKVLSPDQMIVFAEILDIAKDLYHERKFLSGRSYYDHCLEVAYEVAKLKIDFVSIKVAMLHHISRLFSTDDLLKDLFSRYPAVFDNDTKALLSDLHQLGNSTRVMDDEQLLIQYIFHKNKDLRPIIIRIIDKNCMVDTLTYLGVEDSRNAARKMLFVYSKLADYLGLLEYKERFDNFSFKILFNEAYYNVKEYLDSKKLHGELVQIIVRRLESILESSSIKGRIWGRFKSLYSIYRKLEKYLHEGKKKGLADIRDILGVTIIIDSLDDIYLLIDIISASGVRITEIEDYINMPKKNGYKAVHLEIFIDDIVDYPIELHILTETMHRDNTYGEASHFAYKEKLRRNVGKTDKFNWLKIVYDRMYNFQTNREYNLPYSKDLWISIFDNIVMVFTPRKDLIVLPEGSTALDFAYKVHTDLGNMAKRAIINGVHTGLSTILKSGDSVQIITGNNGYDKKIGNDKLGLKCNDKTRKIIRKEIRKRYNMKNK